LGSVEIGSAGGVAFDDGDPFSEPVDDCHSGDVDRAIDYGNNCASTPAQ
jgi:hypothetical protein